MGGVPGQFEFRIAASEPVITALCGLAAYPSRRLDVVRVLGMEKPVVTIHEIFAGDEPEAIRLKAASRRDFEAAMEALH
jgi:hypothetical protein